MNLFRFLWSASASAALNIILLSLINGITGGLLVILFPEAALNIFSTDQYLFYAVTLSLLTVVFLISRHLTQKKTEALAGQAVEEIIVRVANTVRHVELPEFEKMDRSNLLLSIAGGQRITDAALKNMEVLQVYVALLIVWVYIFFSISQLFGLFLLGVRFFMILLREMFRKIIFSYVREEHQEEREMFSAFQHHLYGFKELKFNFKKNENIFYNYLLPTIETGKKKRIRSRQYGTELTLSGILMHLLTMLCCIVFPFGLSHEEISGIIIILLFALQNDMLINSSMQSIAEGTAALRKLHRLFSHHAIKKADEDLPVPLRNSFEQFCSINIEGIKFSYPKQDGPEQVFSVTIDELNIKSGEILFIVGGNGSGKSTLMKVLTGLYPPEQGTVSIDGQSISITDYRDMFSAVFSDFHLFDRLYGLEGVDENRVGELLKITELEGKTQYEQGKFTVQDLSTGQRKRLALIIAMLEDRPIFVFDEWAADQDPYFRRYFYEDILPSLKKQGKAIIAVSHDDRYFHLADKVVRMDYGRITEQWRPGRESPAKLLFAHKPNSLQKRVKKISRQFQHTATSKEKQQSPQQDKNMLEQLREIFQQESNAVKKILYLLPLFSCSLVGLNILLIHAPMLEHLRAAWYISFISFLLLTVFSYRRLHKTFYLAVENRISTLRINVINHVRKTDLQTLRGISRGRVYTALTLDIQAVASTSDIIMLCFQGGIRMIVIYMYIAVLYPPAFILMLLLTGIATVLYLDNHTKLIHFFEQMREQEKKLIDAVTHLIEGFKELKLSNIRSNAFYHETLARYAYKLREIRLQTAHYYTKNSTLTYGFWKSTLLVMIFFLPWIGMPAKVLPVAVALVITMPLRQVIDRYSQFHMAYLSIQRLFSFENMIRNLAREPDVASHAVDLEGYTSIRYENISFTYQRECILPHW
ncbi:MAG: ATP-binding cassette domain-containing protein [Candidatus Electrothrix sp. AX1]|nr:ATP-binding cassette domain-containing protein [Candidatus Electrothrix sp. AX1]